MITRRASINLMDRLDDLCGIIKEIPKNDLHQYMLNYIKSGNIFVNPYRLGKDLNWAGLRTQKYLQRELRKIDYFFFDIDRTLVDTFQKNHLATRDFILEYGGHLGGFDERWTNDNVMTSTIADIIDVAEAEFNMYIPDNSEAELLYEKLLVQYADTTTVYPDVKNLIYLLKNHNKKICLVTNATKLESEPSIKMLEEEIEYGFFDSYVNYSDIGSTKPDEDFVIRSFENLGKEPCQFVVVGDAVNDIRLKEHHHCSLGLCIETNGKAEDTDFSPTFPDLAYANISEMYKDLKRVLK